MKKVGRKAAHRPAVSITELFRAVFTAGTSRQSADRRGGCRAERPRGLRQLRMPAIVPAAEPKVEDTVDLTAHERGGETAEDIETGVLPEDAPRDGHVRKRRVSMAADRVGEAVSGGGRRPHRDRIDRAVWIGEERGLDGQLSLQIEPG